MEALLFYDGRGLEARGLTSSQRARGSDIMVSSLVVLLEKSMARPGLPGGFFLY